MIKVCMVLYTMCILFLSCGQKGVEGRDLRRLGKRDVGPRYIPKSGVGNNVGGAGSSVLKGGGQTVVSSHVVKGPGEGFETEVVDVGGALPVVSPGKKDPATDLEDDDGTAGANVPGYQNTIDLGEDILKDLEAKTFTDREGVVDHFFRLKESFSVLENFKYYSPLNYRAEVGEDGSKFPSFTSNDVLKLSRVPFSWGVYDIRNIYLSSWRSKNYLYAFLYGMNQIEKSVREVKGDVGVYLAGINSFLQKMSSMTYNLDVCLSFPSTKAKDSTLLEKKFRKHIEIKRIRNFNSNFEKYLKKLKSVSDCIFGNVLRVLKKIDTEKDSSQDFYSLFNKMNNDTKITEAIDIVVRDKDSLIQYFKSILNDLDF
ncbi:hypothetical protein [Borrelia persica]|uniref:hypothetical protein n=1 Tax=Borrelia persica TaxID=44448 RepID=UPI000465303A|nr:hypothetical protein [Borrelia persica]